MADNVFASNLLRSASSGYGGSTRPDPYGIYGGLLAQGDYSLSKRRQNKELEAMERELALSEQRFASDMQQQKLQNQAWAYGEGMGSPSELSNWMKESTGFTYNPPSTGSLTNPGTGTNAMNAGDIANTLRSLEQLRSNLYVPPAPWGHTSPNKSLRDQITVAMQSLIG